MLLRPTSPGASGRPRSSVAPRGAPTSTTGSSWRAQAAGVLREDIHPDDLTYVFEQVASLHGANAERIAQPRARYLTLQLDVLHAPDRTPLPGPPPTGDEQHARWQPKVPDS